MSKPSPANVVKAYGAVGPDGGWYEDDSYDRYDDADYGPDSPECQELEFFGELEDESAEYAEKFFKKKFFSALKQMGWTVRGFLFESGRGDPMEWDGPGWIHAPGSVTLIGKAGQKILLPRDKSIVLDRNVNFDLELWSAHGNSQEEVEVGTGTYSGDGWNEPREENTTFVSTDCPDPKDLDAVGWSFEGEDAPHRNKWFKPSQVDKMIELFALSFPKELRIRSKVKKRGSTASASTVARKHQAHRVATAYQIRVGMEHATEEARKKHLKEHPNADPSDHTVEKKEKPKRKLDLGKSLEKSKGVKKKVDEKLDELFDFAGASQYTSKG